MKIALINENSQAPKNSLIFETLKKVAEPKGHECFNYGRSSAEDPVEKSYVQEGLLAAILLNSGAADFVITGCGTGMGAMLALNSFPGVMCGWAHEPLESFLFSQVNAGNALSLPFAMDFGWGAELNLEYIFEKLLSTPMGGGYPEAWAAPEKKNRGILAEVKKVTHKDILTVLKEIDQDFLKQTIGEPNFAEMFFANCKNEEIAAYIRGVLA